MADSLVILAVHLATLTASSPAKPLPKMARMLLQLILPSFPVIIHHGGNLGATVPSQIPRSN
eukprot:scaffold197798_cov78-Attheya_sp.AAC.1